MWKLARVTQGAWTSAQLCAVLPCAFLHNHEIKRSPFLFWAAGGTQSLLSLRLSYPTSITCLVSYLFLSDTHLSGNMVGHGGIPRAVRSRLCQLCSFQIHLTEGQFTPQEVTCLGTAGKSQSRVSAYIQPKSCCLLSITKVFLDFKSILNNSHEGTFSLSSTLCFQE